MTPVCYGALENVGVIIIIINANVRTMNTQMPLTASQ